VERQPSTSPAFLEQTRIWFSVRIIIGLYRILPIPILYNAWHTNRGLGGVVYCAIVVQSYCNNAGNADGEGQERDD